MAANDNNTNSSEKLPREKRESTDKYNPGNQKGKGPVHKEDAEQREDGRPSGR
jgi:hypothetical protein